MKRKIMIFALVAMASVSSVFAASSFGGKARLRLGVKKDTYNSDFRYGMEDAGDAAFSIFLLEDTKESKGKGGTYAEISAIAQIRLRSTSDSLSYRWNPASGLKYRIGLNYANLVFDADKNFKLGISGMNPVQRYAKGWEVELDNGNTIGTTPFMTFATAFKNTDYTGLNQLGNYRAEGGWIPALTLTYDKHALSLSLMGGYSFGSKDDPSFLALYQANDLVVSEGFKLSFNVGAYRGELRKRSSTYDPATRTITDNGVTSLGMQTHVLYGAKFDYKKDDFEFVAGATGNVKVAGDLNFTDVNENNAIEASLNLAYTGDIKFSLDAWFLDNQSLWSDDDEPDWVTYENSADLGFVYRNAQGGWLGKEQGLGANNTVLHKALSIRANVKPIDTLGITLRGQDLLNQCILGLDIPISINDSLTLTPTFEYTFDTEKTYADGAWSNNGGANPIVEGQIAVSYRHSMFTVYGYVRAGAEYDAKNARNADANASNALWIKPYVRIESRNLVDGARLAFQWSHGTFNTDGNLSGTVPSGKYHAGSGLGRAYVEARINF